ncbi:hypothetical protein PHYBLDRAFT_59406 [Phycomyces blakesleeanus NRRL 1555(-)]|uniref:Phospholipase n=1 Tax=Phycomyces blakesleeanus (strain ATCC 8743b / DSM 1359 / FGSC 10004 / NBRC 33097 / NRRL 1555) TaxID=763407 RepID=A0A162PZW1_PHYB8|nr:hypothetical protein PHYBLDRAFT_59406 [Phycomyces blakesleeanus NRRL 1555(-)]OAD75876.1 hypothetical protein PHYBLDRAFT_59406 [Phycomyces blakesleeanus NRRL 1555(-)]|eukprot:XP_018293916.1 hypothetical protein PHYBLDRAFT_59406 [Phycomyces blakesleeanus NRRL 1555(-)]
MSNPVAENAKLNEQRTRAIKTPVSAYLSIDPSRRNTPASPYDDTILSPESPENRQYPSLIRPNSFNRFRNSTPGNQPDDASNFPSQWKRVLDKLSSLAQSDSQNDHGSIETRDESSMQESTENTNEEYELTAPSTQKYYRNKKGKTFENQIEDDALPSAFDIEALENSTHNRPGEDQESYFAHPFSSDRDHQEGSTSGQPIILPIQENELHHHNQVHPHSSEVTIPNEVHQINPAERAHAKQKWTKTLERVKLITNLPNQPHRQPEIPLQLTQTIAPWYPPIFDPPFLSFMTDEHHRKLPPILLQCMIVSVTDSELQTKGINQWIFRMELQYGDVKWVIRKTITDFVSLHYTLKYIAFLADIASTVPTDVFLLDKSFSVTNRKRGIFGRYHNHIILVNRFRRIEIKGSKRQIEEWMESIQKVSKNSPWVTNHRFGSFSPIRHNAKVKWFVDAEDHFNAVAEAILAAKKEIYIADWWLSPELYLRRPPTENEEFRIDRLLQRKASEGVMVYIVVYKEMTVALTILSAHTKRALQNLHPNIIVQRHPDHRTVDNNILFWSHHEKMVVVDNRIAFIGGLDLCWGRYDSHSHRLADYPAKGHSHEIFPGQDYSDPRVKDFLDVTNFATTLVDRRVTPRMPWHDMSIAVVGPIARDVARHFIQRWNFLKSSKGKHRQTVPFLMPKGEFVAERDERRFEGTCRVQLLRSSAEWSSGIEREHSIYNAYMECISKAKHFVYIENQFFTVYFNHNIYEESLFVVSATTQEGILRNKIAQAMVERIKLAHKKKEKFKIFIMIPLIPAFEGDLASKEASAARQVFLIEYFVLAKAICNVMHFQYISISRGGNSIMEKLREVGINPDDYIGWYCLRNWDKITSRDRDDKKSSSSEPTVLSNSTENGSKSNQTPENNPRFSVSGSSEGRSLMAEDDARDYVSELVYIHDKIMIVDDRLVLIGSANINDRSQLGNRDSEVAMLIEDTAMVPSYMNGKEVKAAKFAHSLRMQLWKEHLGLLEFDDWGALCNNPDTIHCKPTPRHTPPSSPNLNDHISNEDMIKDIENKDPENIFDFPRKSEGSKKPPPSIDQSRALDPLSDEFYYGIWRKTANRNTGIYRDLFHCVPDDTVHTFEQHRQFLPDPTKVSHGHVANLELSGPEIQLQLDQVRGHLVEFPTNYLKDENMLGSYLREAITPMTIFT